MKHTVLLFILLLPLPSHAPAADISNSCDAAPRIQEVIKQANRSNIEYLLARYPDNFWVQREYIDLKTGGSYPPSRSLGMPVSKVDQTVIAQFKKEYEHHPDNPQAAYLYAYALIHTDTAESIRILTRITRKTPSFPTAWMTLGILYGYPKFLDREKQRTYIETYLSFCPNTMEIRVAGIALQLDRSDVLAGYMKSLRQSLSGKADQILLPLYSYLWRLELKHVLPGEIEACRERIREDLKFLEGLDPSRFPTARSLIIQGYNQIGDKAALDKLLERNSQFSSIDSFLLFTRARAEWSQANPRPFPTAGAEEQTVYLIKQLQFLDQWQARIPEHMPLLEPRFKALASIPGTSNETLIYEGGRILALARRARSSTYIQPALMVLQTWANRDILLDRIQSLIQELMAQQSQTPPGSVQQSDLMESSENALTAENRLWTTTTNAGSILVTVHTRKGRMVQAREILADWGIALEGRRKKVDEIKASQIEKFKKVMAADPTDRPQNIFNSLETSIVREFPGDESKYYEAWAKLAEAEGRYYDALKYLQSSVRILYGNPVLLADVTDMEKRKAIGNRLWKKTGGTQKGWEEWIQSVQVRPSPQLPSVPRQAMKKQAIPDFSLSDQHGEKWTLAGLKGKTTLLNVWATWCGPCRRELPHLQKLYEQTKDRGDILVVTLNIDENKSLVEPFLKENNLSFPSLYANSFVKEFAGPIGIPTTWIADATGIIRSEERGFRGDGDQWLERMLEHIESIRKISK